MGMRKRVVAAWNLYRHGAALVGLFQALGLWGYIAATGVGVMATLIAVWVALPIWGKILLGLAILALALFCLGLVAAYKKVSYNSEIEPAPGLRSACVGAAPSPLESTMAGGYMQDSEPATRMPKFVYVPAARLFTASKANQIQIDASFLLWPAGSLMLWVLVPQKNEGLRSSPHNRYLLAHFVGILEGREAYRNQFAIRHSSVRNRWEVSTSNEDAEYGLDLTVSDSLDAGWHHLLFSWERSVPRRLFAIDKGDSGTDVSNADFTNWPQQTTKMFIGTWRNPAEWFYCQTELYGLQIFDTFFHVNAPEVKLHFLKPPDARRGATGK